MSRAGTSLDDLKRERARLLAEAERHRFRLLRLPGLIKRINAVTTEILKREAEAPRDTQPEIQPLGDVRPCQHRLPYAE
ncbi:hypothetical protein [Roseibium litorale]|uniref:Uncharacterized protein n=1 Tax=Roseibium litorale TaxID=2803841 RepID=A0ABR9CIG9_9HYPH|nr:hypothetical protein [Roseibium litorale]MBD8890170.1 hypothetical protein [Roseibium litorale]